MHSTILYVFRVEATCDKSVTLKQHKKTLSMGYVCEDRKKCSEVCLLTVVSHPGQLRIRLSVRELYEISTHVTVNALECTKDHTA